MYSLLTAHGSHVSINEGGALCHLVERSTGGLAADRPLTVGLDDSDLQGIIDPVAYGKVVAGLGSSVELVLLSETDVALLDVGTGLYFCAAPPVSGRGVLSPAATTIGQWERFRLEPAAADPLTAALVGNAMSLVQGIGSRKADPGVIEGTTAGLADPAQPWSFERAANLLLMRAANPTRRAAIVASFKNEGASIIEWLAHSRVVGFGHAFIYTNDNTDRSDALLEALHRENRITLIRNTSSRHLSPQIQAYEHSLHLLPALRDFEWAAYFDADELLVPDIRHDHSVVAMIDAIEARWTTERPAAICVNWQWYGSGGHVFRTDGLMQERFLHARPHSYVKSIVRLRDVSSMAAIHIPDPGAVLCVTSGGDRLPIASADAGVVDLSGAKLNHYYHKSFEEFVVKHDRGRGGAPGGAVGKDYRTFFEWDVPPLAARASPTPPALLARVKREMAHLRQLQGVAEAERETLAAHRALSRTTERQSLWEALRAGPAEIGTGRAQHMLAAD